MRTSLVFLKLPVSRQDDTNNYYNMFSITYPKYKENNSIKLTHLQCNKLSISLSSITILQIEVRAEYSTSPSSFSSIPDPTPPLIALQSIPMAIGASQRRPRPSLNTLQRHARLQGHIAQAVWLSSDLFCRLRR